MKYLRSQLGQNVECVCGGGGGRGEGALYMWKVEGGGGDQLTERASTRTFMVSRLGALRAFSGMAFQSAMVQG